MSENRIFLANTVGEKIAMNVYYILLQRIFLTEGVHLYRKKQGHAISKTFKPRINKHCTAALLPHPFLIRRYFFFGGGYLQIWRIWMLVEVFRT